jgi:hypothetical protein
MAYQIKIVKLAVVVTNTITEAVIFAGPRREYYFDEGVLEDIDTIKLIALHSGDNLISKVPLIPLANSLDENNVPFTKAGFQTFGRTYLGHGAVGIDIPGDGSEWLNGSGAPSIALGELGDYYVNNDSGDYYEKTGTTTWTLVGTFTGGGGSVTSIDGGNASTIYLSTQAIDGGNA